MIERCAFLVWSLADRDIPICFRSQRFEFLFPDEGDIYCILRFLSLVEPLVASGDDREPELPVDDSNPQIIFSAQPRDFEPEWAGAHVVGPGFGETS